MQIDNILKNKVLFVDGIWKSNHELLPSSNIKITPTFLLHSFNFSNSKILAINLACNGFINSVLENKNSLVVIEEDPQVAKAISSFLDQANHLLISEKFLNLEFKINFDLIILDSNQFDLSYEALTKLKSILVPEGVLLIIGSNYNQSLINSYQHNYIYRVFPSIFKPNLIIEGEFLKSNIIKEFLSKQIENLESKASDSFVALFDSYSSFITELPKAVFYNTNRLPKWQTENLIYEKEKNLFIEKKLLYPEQVAKSSLLNWQATKDYWVNSPNILSMIESNACKYADYHKIFAPVQIWIDYLKSQSLDNNLITGTILDCLWSNSFIIDGNLKLIDQEWAYAKNISLNVYFIRAVYYFLLHVTKQETCPKFLKISNWYKQIRKIAGSFSLILTDDDFTEFVNLEVYLRTTVQGLNENTTRRNLKIQLYNYKLYLVLKAIFSKK